MSITAGHWVLGRASEVQGVPGRAASHGQLANGRGEKQFRRGPPGPPSVAPLSCLPLFSSPVSRPRKEKTCTPPYKHDSTSRDRGSRVGRRTLPPGEHRGIAPQQARAPHSNFARGVEELPGSSGDPRIPRSRARGEEIGGIRVTPVRRFRFPPPPIRRAAVRVEG